MRKRVKDNSYYLGFEIAVENLKGFVRKSNGAEDEKADVEITKTHGPTESRDTFARNLADSEKCDCRPGLG